MQKWSAEEIQILREVYRQNDLSLLAVMLPHRSYSSCKYKAQKLELKTREHWSEEELSVLKENYSKCTIDEMIALLSKRNRKTIIQRACELNLRNVCKFQDWETQYIIDPYQYMTDKEIGKVLNRNWHTILDKRCRMKLNKEHLRTCYEDIYDYLRRNNAEWKTLSMKQCNYKCVITGGRFDEIHHIYGFNRIVDETLEYLHVDKNIVVHDIDESDLDVILQTFRSFQNKYPLGVCLTKEIHKDFHSLYGYGNNTLEQWNEYIKKY